MVKMKEPISLKIARLESLLITNKKFSKKWLNMLESHTNGCPCIHNNYVKSTMFNFKFRKCPFGLRKHDKKNDMYSTKCFTCEFSRLLNHTPHLRFFHLIHTIKNVIGQDHESYGQGDSFFSEEI